MQCKILLSISDILAEMLTWISQNPDHWGQYAAITTALGIGSENNGPKQTTNLQ